MSHKRLLITVLSIVVAVAMALPSLGGTSSALAQDGGYKEAPMLAAKVAAGELPPVEERLPANPRVVANTNANVRSGPV